MNIMIIGDDHGASIFDKAYSQAKEKCASIDAIIHTGDSERVDDDYYQDICGHPIHMVRGNNDFNGTPQFLDLRIGGKNIFVTHGHRYGVYMGAQTLYYAGLEHGADIIIYGHTHRADHLKGKEAEIINPGSLSGVRSGCCSYAILSIEEDGSVSVNFYQVDKNH